MIPVTNTGPGSMCTVYLAAHATRIQDLDSALERMAAANTVLESIETHNVQEEQHMMLQMPGSDQAGSIQESVLLNMKSISRSTLLICGIRLHQG